MINNIKKYVETNNQTINDLNNAMKTIVSDMEKNIIKNLKRLGKLNNGAEGFADQIYKAENWIEIQENVYNKKAVILRKFFKKFQSEITELKKIYPESKFQNSALVWQWEQYDKYLNKDLDILKLLSSSKSDIQGISALSQMSVITDVTDDIINTVEKSLGGSISHMQTRLTTSNSVVSANIRKAFFRTVKQKTQKKYLYMHVIDGKTRPFCRKHAGVIKTAPGWKTTYNGQIGSAWDYAGGFNCRGVILLVSELWTKEEVLEMHNVSRVYGS